MRVANQVPDILANIQQSQQNLATDLQQVSTGLRVNQPSDDPAASANLATSLASSARVDQYTKNISTVTSQLQTADSAISSVVTSLTSAVGLGSQAATGTSATLDKQAIATQVQGILSDVVSRANTTYQGAYVFGGSASTSAPVLPAASTYTTTQASVLPPLTALLPLTPGSVTTVSDAATGKTFVVTITAGETISAFTAAIAGAAASGILSAGTTASISGGQLLISTNSPSHGLAVSSNDPVLGQFRPAADSTIPNSYAYVGNSAVNSVQVGDSLNVATNLPGNQIFTAGPNVIGALNGLLTSLQGGTSAQIENATTAVSTALNAVNLARVPIDNSIGQLNSQESFLSQEKVTLTTAQTNLIGADLATAATNLAHAQVQNSAVLAAAARVAPQSLLNYLSPPVG